MRIDDTLRAQWILIRDRLLAKELLQTPDARLSIRIPGSDCFWFGAATDSQPRRVAGNDTADVPAEAERHARIYAHRGDVGAIAGGGGPFGRRLGDFGGVIPGVFDEQVRHLGRMGGPVAGPADLPAALSAGGNVLIDGAQPICLGVTGPRLALNAELFEKCAKAYVLAVAAGGNIKPLPWLVRHVANRRLMKDERNAADSFRRGVLPVESRGY